MRRRFRRCCLYLFSLFVLFLLLVPQQCLSFSSTRFRFALSSPYSSFASKKQRRNCITNNKRQWRRLLEEIVGKRLQKYQNTVLSTFVEDDDNIGDGTAAKVSSIDNISMHPPPPPLSTKKASAAATAEFCTLEKILRFTRTNPNAVVLSLWPSAILHDKALQQQPQIAVAKKYLEQSGATILYEATVEVPADNGGENNENEVLDAATLLTMAMYWGEDWLETNCWYGEQPLEELGIGLVKPRGFWPGAKWKKELCFRQNRSGPNLPYQMHVLVADAAGSSTITYRRHGLWSEKYSVRARMARDTGHAGNSCMHLTDDQSSFLQQRQRQQEKRSSSFSYDCNASFAVACARCLLNPHAMAFLRQYPSDAAGSGPGTPEFKARFGAFCKWLGDSTFDDIIPVSDENVAEVGGSASSVGDDNNSNAVTYQWNAPPPF